MSDVRKMTSDSLEEMLNIVAYAFQWELSERNVQRFTSLAEHSWNYGSFDENDDLASQVMATPFQVDLFGDRHVMAGIGFVATYPEYRSQGRIDRIMKQLLADCREEGVTLSYLAPFSYSFYRRYGYELTFERAVYEVPSIDWPDSARTAGQVKRLSWEKAQGVIQEVYQKAPKHHKGGLVREDWWEQFKFPLRKDYQYAIYYDEKGIAQGYLVYLLAPGIFTIAEWSWLTGAAFSGLNRFVASHKGSVAKIVYDVGFDGDNLQFLATNPMTHFRVRPEMMARVVDVKRFLKASKKIRNLKKSIAFEITDDVYAPWNQGIFELQKQGADVGIKQVEATVLPTISLTIQRFTQLFMGYLTPEVLLAYDFLKMDENLLEDLKEIVPNQKPILEDYF
ncbi:GNAT family N-acetyltransferase [Enterococcus asini]|uniref:GNAT family N-acetyltransferase n=1 Tax=Enterococcus asini TaxID=57732 RepID=UPI00288DC986|nr:GNAT family N-acetyltransferase [Enterococcus asini]MDT2756567.1 GNAT family N-acetyltransferase [Enterococcus asini]